MRGYLAKRVLSSVLTLVGLVVIVFFVTHVLPGDAAAVRLGPNATAAEIEALRDEFGLDDPIMAQFSSYIGRTARFDLGTSIDSGREIRSELATRLPATIELAGAAVLLGAVVGIPLGTIAALRRGGVIDGIARIGAVLGSSVALFWLGLLLTFVFYFKLDWLPGPIDRLPLGTTPPPRTTGLYTVDSLLAGDLARFWQAIRALALPAITLGFAATAPVMKMVRSSMIAALDSPYVRTARSLGIAERRVVLQDAFRNALVPVITVLGITTGYLIGGNIIVEFVFSWPGIGSYAYNALQKSDLEALQGFVVVVGALYIGLNLLIDLCYAFADPRVRLAGGTEQ
jgi:ABC-type dipeptide/oligopeptide/nickel transport system permease component